MDCKKDVINAVKATYGDVANLEIVSPDEWTFEVESGPYPRRVEYSTTNTHITFHLKNYKNGMLLCSTEYEHEIVLNSINDSMTEKVNKGTINVLDGLSYKGNSEEWGIDNPTSDTPLNVEWTITQKNKPFQIEYTTSDNKILILSSSENKVITSVMDSHTYSNDKGVILFSDVPEIGYYAFAYADGKNETNKLISIIIPEGVTEIAMAAFEQCFSLTTVTIPNSVIKMESPFMLCSKLKTINYNGTIAQWNAIRKINWDFEMPTTC